MDSFRFLLLYTSRGSAASGLFELKVAAEAEVLLFLIDARAGVTAGDQIIAEALRKSGKPVFVAVNKVDTHLREGAVTEFSQLGFEKIFPVSA